MLKDKISNFKLKKNQNISLEKKFLTLNIPPMSLNIPPMSRYK